MFVAADRTTTVLLADNSNKLPANHSIPFNGAFLQITRSINAYNSISNIGVKNIAVLHGHPSIIDCIFTSSITINN